MDLDSNPHPYFCIVQESESESGNVINSAIHKAGGFTVHSRSTGLPGIIPVEQKSVHWLSMGAAGRNTAALWIAL